ncbi:MAG TPA: cellulase family glycosylhydrolase [Dongiaceae bacterium]|nr:cellulase family glycosylhydrolase [Dongiaceae bacterium]
MKHRDFWMICCLVSSLCFGRLASASPIAKHPDNPHYFVYKGKPLVLISTDHHYGAIINLDFDYVPFLDRLHEYGMNLTRIYPGAYLEMKDQYVKGNPLGPSPDRYILPWKKSTVTGADVHLGTYKYDLESWDQEYFNRLRDFVSQAAQRDIIVEVAFFNGMYDDRWKAQATYHANNIQGIGTKVYQDFTTGVDKALTEVQLKYVKKIASELKDFDNVIYDISDEPEMEKQNSWLWNSAMLDALISVDQNRHVYGETAHSASPDFTKDPRISWLPTEYISPMEKTLDENYADAKPIIDVETSYYPLWYDHPVEETRAEGWYGMLGGLAGMIHLNSDFSTSNPSAHGTSTETEILPQKRALAQFMQSLDFVQMTKFTGFRVTTSGALARAISETGKQYAVYLFHGSRKWDDWPQGPTSSRLNVDLNWFTDSLSIDVPRGTYKIEWINPASGALIQSSSQHCNGGNCILETPRYFFDIALRMRRVPDATALN